MSDSEDSERSISTLVNTNFFERGDGFHQPPIRITERIGFFARTFSQFVPKMPNIEGSRAELAASLARGKKLNEDLEEIRQQLKALGVKITRTAPSGDEIVEAMSEISINRHEEIRKSLSEIRDFDRTTDVEAFSIPCRKVNKQMKTEADQISLINKIIALKLKGGAIAVADRLAKITSTGFSEAMCLATGKKERDHSPIILHS
ncbi:hypothetical protein QAD02_012839 [Eretmocerus hayati]|uniref:Uncharacterized protein n=1 Tax=Eretmocerus hayati TaxID=131215 RepID=A0ACC2P3N8_9HYME|nr:hypothetical protein QAD02_012839 [Eretmocerus hayati]